MEQKYICQYCQKEFKNSGALKMHETTCIANPNRDNALNLRKKREDKIYSEDELTCKYCGRVFKRMGDKKQHETQCKLNPNKKVKHTLKSIYESMSDEELLIEVKKYTTRKETPNQLIRECRTRNIYSWRIGKYEDLTDDVLLNKLEEYNRKTDIPYAIKKELNRRNIHLPKRFSVNPRKKVTAISDLSSEELYDQIKDCIDSYDINEKGLYHILLELKKRKYKLPKKFKQNITYTKYHYWSDEQIINLLSQYSSKTNLEKAGYSAVLKEAFKRKLTNLPEYCYKTNYTKYHYMTNDELISIIKNYKTHKELANSEDKAIIVECKKRNIDLSIYIKQKAYHPEYLTMTDDELIDLAKKEFNDLNIKNAGKLNRSLLNNIRKRNILYSVFDPNTVHHYKENYTLDSFIKQAKEKYGDRYFYYTETFKGWKKKMKMRCPVHGDFEQTPLNHLHVSEPCTYCAHNTNFFKGDKLQLLEETDLLSMNSFSLISLIDIDKLPKDFKSFAIFARNSQNRQTIINKLKESYRTNNGDIQDIDTNNGEIQSEDYSCDTFNNIDEFNTFNEDEASLKTFNEIETVDKILSKSSTTNIGNFGDNEEFLLRTEVNALICCLLRDIEKARLNKSTNLPTIIRIKAEFSTATPWKKYVYTEFLRIYNNVKNMKVS